MLPAIASFINVYTICYFNFSESLLALVAVPSMGISDLAHSRRELLQPVSLLIDKVRSFAKFSSFGIIESLF